MSKSIQKDPKGTSGFVPVLIMYLFVDINSLNPHNDHISASTSILKIGKLRYRKVK